MRAITAASDRLPGSPERVRISITSCGRGFRGREARAKEPAPATPPNDHYNGYTVGKPTEI